MSVETGLLAGLAGAVLLGLLLLGRTIDRSSRTSVLLETLTAFAPALKETAEDPRALLVWMPLVRAARRACPEVFAQLDRLWGRPFPLSAQDIEEAHARWSAQWLAWESRHEAEYRMRAASIEAELRHARDEAATALRAQLDAVEHEKLERYQQRYEEYVRVSKALAALVESAPRGGLSGTGSPG